METFGDVEGCPFWWHDFRWTVNWNRHSNIKLCHSRHQINKIKTRKVNSFQCKVMYLMNKDVISMHYQVYQHMLKCFWHVRSGQQHTCSMVHTKTSDFLWSLTVKLWSIWFEIGAIKLWSAFNLDVIMPAVFTEFQKSFQLKVFDRKISFGDLRCFSRPRNPDNWPWTFKIEGSIHILKTRVMNWAVFILHVFTFQPLLSVLNATLLHKMLLSSYLYPLSYA